MRRHVMETLAEPEVAPLQIELTMMGEPVVLEHDAPVEPTVPRRVLPIFQAFTDELVKRSARASEAEGKAISARGNPGTVSVAKMASPGEASSLAESSAPVAETSTQAGVNSVPCGRRLSNF